MKKVKKIFCILLAAASLSSLLAGCAGTNSQSSAIKDDMTTSGPAKIQFWHSLSGKNGDYLNEMIKRFNDSHKNIQVVGTYQGDYDDGSTKLQQAIASGSTPDIAMIERAYVESFAESGALEDLTPYMKSSKVDKSAFKSGLLGHSVFDNKFVAVPFNRSTPILHVNKTLLDQKGLAVPKTWDDLKKVANALVEKKNGQFTRYGATMIYDTWYPIAMIEQAGGSFFSSDKKTIGFYDNGVGVKVFDYLKDLQSTGALYYPPSKDSANICTQMFESGKVAMMYQSTGAIGELSRSVKFDYVTAFLPQDKQYANPTGGANLALLSKSKLKKSAWEFLNWVEFDPKGAEPFIVKSGYLPFTNAMVESDDIKNLWKSNSNYKVAYDQLQYAKDTNLSVKWPNVMNEYFSAIQSVMYDHQDSKSAMDTFKKAADKSLAE